MNDEEKDQEDQDAGQHDDNHENENESELTPEQKAQQEAEDFILNFKDEDYDDPEKVKKLEDIQKNNKLLKTTIQQKNHWRQKATANKPEPAAPAKTPKAPVKTETDTKDQRYSGDALTDFRLDHRELDKATVSEIVKYAKANDCTLDEAMKAEPIKIMVREKAKKEDVEDASINSNQNRKPASGIAARDWTNASREEIEKERLRIMGQEG